MAQQVQVATTTALDGWRILDYRGVISTHVVAGTGFLSDFVAGFSDIFGGRSGTYQKQLGGLQSEVVADLQRKASRAGANWVIGLRIDFDEISGKGMQMFMVSALGTAVLAERLDSSQDVVSVQRSMSGADLEAGLRRIALVEEARNEKLVWDDATWVGLAEHKVVEAIPKVVENARDGFYDVNARPRGLDLCRALPAEGVQKQLHQLLLAREALESTTILFIAELGMVDLTWVQANIRSNDFRVRKAALRLLQASAPHYTSTDVPMLEDLVAFLPQAFPDLSRLVEGKKGLLSRTSEQRWLCYFCNTRNDLDAKLCGNCQLDRRGIGMNDFSPERASERLKLQLKVLREAFGDGEAGRPPESSAAS